ncbi:MAG: ribbon-helix-helix protein, CopG family [Sulfolobaceae archaeon]|jgi:metal-responsive CopG/Arc/MetJ family transcriptional regulator
MRKVVSVRLREDIVRDIDIYTKKLGLNSRTAFIKEALNFYMKRKAKENL